MATMNDIARELGVTKSTVSKALSGASDISDSTRTVILEKAVEMGYTRLTRNAVGKIAVFIENMKWEKPEDFGWEIITGFRKAAEPAGYIVDIIELDNTLEQEMSYDAYMLKHDYRCGFFLGLTFEDLWIKDLETSHTPTVLLDFKIQENPSAALVSVDNAEAMSLILDKLTELGHTKIGYLSGGLGNYINQDRYQMFLRALRTKGLPEDPSLMLHAYHTHEILGSHVPELLKQGCTAIVCNTDLLAHSVMMTCQELGKRIPQDISIIGYDDIPLCRYISPTLTTIRQNRTGLGKSAYYAVSSLMNRVPISSVLLHAELICRDSIAACPKRESEQ